MTLGLYFGFFAVRFAREPRRRSEGVEFLVDIGGGKVTDPGTFQRWVIFVALTLLTIFRTKDNTKNISFFVCSRVNKGSTKYLLNLILLFRLRSRPSRSPWLIITIRLKILPLHKLKSMYMYVYQLRRHSIYRRWIHKALGVNRRELRKLQIRGLHSHASETCFWLTTSELWVR